MDGGSTDNCGIAGYALDVSDFSCAHVGAQTVTLTVTDDNGLTSLCDKTVAVRDVTVSIPMRRCV